MILWKHLKSNMFRQFEGAKVSIGSHWLVDIPGVLCFGGYLLVKDFHGESFIITYYMKCISIFEIPKYIFLYGYSWV